MDKKEVIQFKSIIPPNTEKVFSERIKADGTVEELRVKFYSGQERTLQVRPTIRHKGNLLQDLVTYPSDTEQYLSGDNDYFAFDLTGVVENDDEIKIFVTNNNPDYSYTLDATVTIDYYGGKNRIIGGVV